MYFRLSSKQGDIVRHFQKEEVPIYVVGGAIRDHFLARQIKDVDLATPAHPEAVQALVQAAGHHTMMDQVAEEHGITFVPDGENRIEIATFRRDISSVDGRHSKVVFTHRIDKDLARRDFTMNAMAAELLQGGRTGPVIDPFEGLIDLTSKVLRFVGKWEERLEEDFLRIFRFARFTALGLKPTSLEGIVEFCTEERLKKVAVERIREEMMKALGYDQPDKFFRVLQSFGLLEKIFPEMAEGVGCTQNEHHLEDVFDHQMRALSHASSHDPLFSLAVATHDVGKPYTKSTGDDGRVHFYQHEITSETIMRHRMKKMTFSRKDTDRVCLLVRNHQWRFDQDTHLRISCLDCYTKQDILITFENKHVVFNCSSCESSRVKRKPLGRSSDGSYRRWLRTVGDSWYDLFQLRICDRRGNLKKEGRPSITWAMRQMYSTCERIIAEDSALCKEDLAINGRDLIEMGFTPGLLFKEIFSDLLERVLDDPSLNEKEWMKNYVMETWKNDGTTD